MPEYRHQYPQSKSGPMRFRSSILCGL
jgi:hypothetical protein